MLLKVIVIVILFVIACLFVYVVVKAHFEDIEGRLDWYTKSHK